MCKGNNSFFKQPYMSESNIVLVIEIALCEQLLVMLQKTKTACNCNIVTNREHINIDTPLINCLHYYSVRITCLPTLQQSNGQYQRGCSQGFRFTMGLYWYISFDHIVCFRYINRKIYILIHVCDSSSSPHGPPIASPSGCLRTMWALHVTPRVKVCLYNEIRTHQPILFLHPSRLVSPAAILSTAMTYKLRNLTPADLT